MEPNNDENKNPFTNKNRPSAEGADPIDRDQKLSLINRKFLSGRAFEPPPDRDNFLGFRPQYFFFYGSLMDARQLRKVLQLQETPVLQSASIVGWNIMLWGQYPALVFKANTITHGMAYEVQEEHVEYLMRLRDRRLQGQGMQDQIGRWKRVGWKDFHLECRKGVIEGRKFRSKGLADRAS
ncbi:hypothetical protein BDZ45DRAFT_734121 [Acephala macrosclerotiorum]|nr:hypothetical protein BDZ45DRAFT_734121 [Acephala macrosclerotiorum]